MVRVLTLHVDRIRLTPEVVRVLGAVAEELGSPQMKRTSDGVAFYVDDYSRRI